MSELLTAAQVATDNRATQAGDIPTFGHLVCQDYRPHKVSFYFQSALISLG